MFGFLISFYPTPLSVAVGVMLTNVLGAYVIVLIFGIDNERRARS